MELPQKYHDARRLISEILQIDECKDLRDKAIALKEYAIRAGDRSLAADAAEYRARSERRLGELMALLPKNGGGYHEHRGQKSTGSDSEPSTLTLQEYGVGKALAQRARDAAKMEDKEWEEYISAVRRVSLLLGEGIQELIKEARAANRAKVKARREQRHKDIAVDSKLVDASGHEVKRQQPGQYALIYADPPWTFETFNEKGKDRSPDNHYPTMDDMLICNLQVGGYKIHELAAPDSVLFLWCTSPNLNRALKVLWSWGFVYKSSLIWDKETIGTGYIFRNQHEILLYGSRGKPPPPLQLFSSVFRERKTTHSTKPAGIRTMLEEMYPHFDEHSRIELFARGAYPNWAVWGNEAF